MTDISPFLQRIDSIVIEAGLQLAQPTRYDPKRDAIRVDLVDDWWLEFDADMLQFPAALWEQLVRADAEKLRWKMRRVG